MALLAFVGVFSNKERWVKNKLLERTPTWAKENSNSGEENSNMG